MSTDGEAAVPETDTGTGGATAGPTRAGVPVADGRTIPWGKVALGALIAFAALYAPYYFQEDMNRVLSECLYLAIAAMGLNLLTGYNGQVSIGHGAFFGVGAFTTALLMADHGWTFEATIPVAAVLAAIVGVAIGIPALRVRGLYLALVTLGLAVLFPALATKYVHGTGGVALVRPKSSGFGSLLDGLANDQWKYLECLVIAVVLFVLAWNIVRGRQGRAMIATRDQELAASTVGVDLARVKVTTFAISAAYAGIAGSLSVMVNGFADGTNPILYFQLSIEFLVAVVIGGAATILGPAVGAFLLVFLRRNTQNLVEGKEVLAPAVLGAALILIVFVLPEGVVGGLRRLTARLRRHGEAPPPTALTAGSPTTAPDPPS